jgi:hypothetical protein
MERDPSGEANLSTASPIPSVLRNQKIEYRIYQNLTFVTSLSQISLSQSTTTQLISVICILIISSNLHIFPF